MYKMVLLKLASWFG